MNILKFSEKVLPWICFLLVPSAFSAPLQLEVSPAGQLTSLPAAQKALREAHATGQLTNEGAVISVRAGIYELTESLRLAHDDGAQNGPIVWQAAAGETVVIRGGSAVRDWQRVSDPAITARLAPASRSAIRVADLHQAGISSFGEIEQRGNPGLEVFFGGERMPLARYPNTGWLLVADVPQTGPRRLNEGLARERRYDNVPVGRHYGRITFDDPRPAGWSADNEIYAHGYWTWDWSDSFQRIASIDAAKRELHFAEPHHHYGYTRGQRFYFLNVLEELDRPGEWYLDRRRGLLYFYPPAEITSDNVVVSLVDAPLIELQDANNVRITGFTFEASRGSGVVIRGGSDVTLAGCTFRNLGGEAVTIEGGQRHRVQSCDFYELANGAIRVGGGDRRTLAPSGHEIVNNHIRRFGQWLRTGQYGIQFDGVGHRIAHNLIHDAPFEGLRLTGNDHLVEYNELHSLTRETGDAGAMHTGRDYTWRGNVFRYNYWHHMTGPGLHGATSYYLDDFASGFDLIGNIFYRAGRAVQIGGGRENLVANNLFIECAPAVHLDARGLGWASNYFNGDYPWLFDRFRELSADQPPYAERYPVLRTLLNDEPPVPKNNRFVHNISWGGRWMDLYDFYAYNFHEVVEVRQNVIADPEFVRRRAERETTWDPYYLNIDGQQGYRTYRTAELEIAREFTGNLLMDEPPGTFDPVTLRFTPRDPKLLKQIGWLPIPVERIGLQRDTWRRDIPRRTGQGDSRR